MVSFKNTTVQVLCVLRVISTQFLQAEGDIQILDDVFLDTWSRAKIVDEFDDSELRRTVVYPVESADEYMVDEIYLMREIVKPIPNIPQTKEVCTTYPALRFYTLSLEPINKRPMIPLISVSFNFKKEGEDDLKILNIPFFDRSTASDTDLFQLSTFSGKIESPTSLALKNKNTKKLINAFLAADEVRIKAEMDSSFIGDQTTNWVFNMKADLSDFKAKWIG